MKYRKNTDKEREEIQKIMLEIKKVIAPYGPQLGLNALVHILFDAVDFFLEDKGKIQLLEAIARESIRQIKELNEEKKNENDGSNDQIKNFKRSRKTKKQISENSIE
jgi:hypothetical protein